MLSTDLFHVWLFFIRTKRSGDIEQNPEPKPNSCQNFLFVTEISKAFRRTISSNYPY